MVACYSPCETVRVHVVLLSECDLNSDPVESLPLQKMTGPIGHSGEGVSVNDEARSDACRMPGPKGGVAICGAKPFYLI